MSLTRFYARACFFVRSASSSHAQIRFAAVCGALACAVTLAAGLSQADAQTPATAVGTPTQCTPMQVTITPGKPVVLPVGTTQITLSTVQGTPLAGPADWSVNVTSPTWSPTVEDVAALNRALNASAKVGPFVRVERQGQLACLAAVRVADASAGPSSESAASAGTSGGAGARSSGMGTAAATSVVFRVPGGVTPTEACQTAGAAAEGSSNPAASRDGARTTVVLFLDTGAGSEEAPCYVSPRAAVVGNVIRAGVFTPVTSTGGLARTEWTRIEFQPCALEAAAPNVLRTEEKQSSAPQSGETEATYRPVFF